MSFVVHVAAFPQDNILLISEFFCSWPPTLSHAALNVTGLSIGNSAVYSCETGYKFPTDTLEITVVCELVVSTLSFSTVAQAAWRDDPDTIGTCTGTL